MIKFVSWYCEIEGTSVHRFTICILIISVTLSFASIHF